MAPKDKPYGTTIFHCAGVIAFKFGLYANNKIKAETPIRIEAVPAAPIAGKRVLAIAAPHCTLIIARSTAGTGEMLNSLFFIGRFEANKTTNFYYPMKFLFN